MNNVIKITLNSSLYNLEAILNACYAFIDRAYVFLDTDSSEKKILVFLKGKQKFSFKKIEQLKGDFINELLHCSLRYRINKNNKKIREYIIGRALYSASSVEKEGFLLAEDSDKLNYQDDPLGIAIPWEEKYGKKKKSKKVKV